MPGGKVYLLYAFRVFEAEDINDNVQVGLAQHALASGTTPSSTYGSQRNKRNRNDNDGSGDALSKKKIGELLKDLADSFDKPIEIAMGESESGKAADEASARESNASAALSTERLRTDRTKMVMKLMTELESFPALPKKKFVLKSLISYLKALGEDAADYERQLTELA
jgi:hypothetical protein